MLDALASSALFAVAFLVDRRAGFFAFLAAFTGAALVPALSSLAAVEAFLAGFFAFLAFFAFFAFFAGFGVTDASAFPEAAVASPAISSAMHFPSQVSSETHEPPLI